MSMLGANSIFGTNNMWGANSILAGMYQYADKARKTATNEVGFAEQLQKTAEAADTSGTGAYMEYLRSKYGNVKIQSVGKDQQSLDRMGKSMSGNDVVIAPNILEQMADNPEKAAYYEGKIDYFFNTIIPRETALCAAKGLVFEPCGVVVHEDGTVTYICGCSDSPKRVAEVNAINKAKREKEAAWQRLNLKRGREAAENRKQEMEIAYRRQSMAELLAYNAAGMGRMAYAGMPGLMGSGIASYGLYAMVMSGIFE